MDRTLIKFSQFNECYISHLYWTVALNFWGKDVEFQQWQNLKFYILNIWIIWKKMKMFEIEWFEQKTEKKTEFAQG